MMAKIQQVWVFDKFVLYINLEQAKAKDALNDGIVRLIYISSLLILEYTKLLSDYMDELLTTCMSNELKGVFSNFCEVDPKGNIAVYEFCDMRTYRADCI